MPPADAFAVIRPFTRLRHFRYYFRLHASASCRVFFFFFFARAYAEYAVHMLPRAYAAYAVIAIIYADKAYVADY